MSANTIAMHSSYLTHKGLELRTMNVVVALKEEGLLELVICWAYLMEQCLN